MFLRLHQTHDQMLLEDADCHFEGADFRDGVASVVKTHHPPNPSRWSPDEVVIWHTGRHGVNQEAEMKRNGYNVQFVADIDDVAKYGHRIVYKYQSPLDLGDGQVEQLAEYLRYWDILRFCCGGPMSIDWLNVLQETPGYQFKHDPHSALAANCQMYDITTVEKLFMNTTLYRTVATYKKRYRFLPREYDGGHCKRFNAQIKSELAEHPAATLQGMQIGHGHETKHAKMEISTSSRNSSSVAIASIHWIQLGERQSSLSSFQFHILCLAMVLRLQEDAHELLNKMSCRHEQYGATSFSAGIPAVVQSSSVLHGGNNVQIFQTAVDGGDEAARAVKGRSDGVHVMANADVIEHGHYIGYMYQDVFGLTDAQLSVLTDFLRYWTVLQACCADDDNLAYPVHSAQYPACEMYVKSPVQALFQKNQLFATLTKLPLHLHFLLKPCGGSML